MSKYQLISVYFLKHDMFQSPLIIICNKCVLQILDKLKNYICWKLDPIPVTPIVLSVEDEVKCIII
jgi:hypothetical protein